MEYKKTMKFEHNYITFSDRNNKVLNKIPEING